MAQQHSDILPPDETPLADKSATLDLLVGWMREDATDDPAAIAEAERDLTEFKTALNQNRRPPAPLFL